MTFPKMYWHNRQWMVTALGLQTVETRGAYSHFIRASELHTIDSDYIQYLKEKKNGWSMDQFREALGKAIEIHARLKETARLKAKTKRDKNKARTAAKLRPTRKS